MKTIYTRKGEEILVDDEDYERLNQCTWRIDSKGYAVRQGRHPITNKKTRVYMHREVMGVRVGDPRKVDHRFHVTNDNRKSELRVCTRAQNAWNIRKQTNNTSGYKNVVWVEWRNKWVSRISVEGRRRLVGYFDTAEEAHDAYHVIALTLHGEFACTE